MFRRSGTTMWHRSGAVIAAGVLVACGSGDDVRVDGAWSRASAPTQTSGVVYLDLTVAADDTLTGTAVAASIAGDAAVHEVVGDGMSMDDMPLDHLEDGIEMTAEASMDEMSMPEGSQDVNDGADTTVRMQPLSDGLVLTGGRTVSFQPGGLHVMLSDLARPLEVGDEFALTLQFEHAGDVDVAVVVAENAP